MSMSQGEIKSHGIETSVIDKAASTSAHPVESTLDFTSETDLMETKSSHVEEHNPLQSLISSKRRKSRVIAESGRSENVMDVPSTGVGNSREGSMMENLQDRLTTMRDGFLERYNISFIPYIQTLL